MEEKNYKEIGSSLKRSREAKGYTQEAFALALKLTPRMIQRYEEGWFPKYKKDSIVRIDELLGTTFYDMIYDKELRKVDNGADVTGIETLGIPYKNLELGEINVTVADYIKLQDDFRKMQGDYLKSLLHDKESNSTSVDVQLGELMKTMRIDHAQILQALDKVLALPPGSLSKETDKIKDAVDKKVKERSNTKD